jgi:regulator of protease activity HflC (stomatin/prohibitin superfamily)
VTLTLLMVVALLAPFILVFIEAGHGGVLWRRFGGGTEFRPALGEGIHIIMPWNRVTIYDLRLHYWQNRLEALTSDGLSVYIDASLRYRLSPNNLAYLHQSVGPDYVAKIIEPQVGSIVRQLVSDYPTQALLGSARNEIRHTIFLDLTDRNRLNEMAEIDPVTGSDAAEGPLGRDTVGNASVWGSVNTGANTLNRPLILLQDFLISRIVIPDRLSAAIEAKLVQSQVAASYQYRLDAERLESDRKFIEAEGIRRFQEVISQSLTPAYLTFLGVQATESLAKSNNAKTLIIGGKNGLPVILNTGDSLNLSGLGLPDGASPTGSPPDGASPNVVPLTPTPPATGSAPPQPGQ